MSQGKEEVTVLGFWASPFVHRVIWALKLKGVDFEYIEEDIFNKSPLLLRLNPVHRRVPVLVHGDAVICESFVILQYIDDTWPDHYPLLPIHPYDRAMARFWAEFAENKLLDTAWIGLCSRGEEREKAAKLAAEAVGKIEEEVMAAVGSGKKKVVAFGESSGDNEERSIGYLDICLGWISYWLPLWEEVGCMRIVDPTKFPATTSWMDAVAHHPVISANLPPRPAMLRYFRKRSIDVYESRSASASLLSD